MPCFACVLILTSCHTVRWCNNKLSFFLSIKILQNALLLLQNIANIFQIMQIFIKILQNALLLLQHIANIFQIMQIFIKILQNALLLLQNIAKFANIFQIICFSIFLINLQMSRSYVNSNTMLKSKTS